MDNHMATIEFEAVIYSTLYYSEIDPFSLCCPSLFILRFPLGLRNF